VTSRLFEPWYLWRTAFCTDNNIIKVFYSPIAAQVIVLKTTLKYYIKTAPTCFGAVTPSSSIHPSTQALQPMQGLGRLQ
jgi:hypothetical protein